MDRVNNFLNKYLLRMSVQDQILFTKRLSILIKAGVPILEALRMLQKQATSRSNIHILQSLITDVEAGQFLAAGMRRFKKVFGEFTVNIVEVGEVSGTLEDNLNYLADELKKAQTLRRKVISSMIYPAIIIAATLGVTIVLTVFVFPKILPIFQSLNYQLPWTTRTLIFISNSIQHYWLFIILAVTILVVTFILLMRNVSFRFAVHRTVLRVPVLGKLLQSYYMANFCRTLGLLLKSDVRIVRATTITADSTTNLVYQRELHNIAENVTKGEKISAHMETNKRLFPPILSQMVMVGESTGNLSHSLMFLAELYENEVDDQTKNLSTVLEPVLMIFMGLVVGFVAVSIITPIYGITQHISPK